MEDLKLAECMSKQFVTFTPETPVVEAAMKLVRNELIGGPVVDQEGTLIGWISEQDCINAVSQVLYYEERVATVADVMRTEVLTARESDSLVDLSQQMQQNKPKIYPVVTEDRKVLGVISRRIILREMCKVIKTQGKAGPLKMED